MTGKTIDATPTTKDMWEADLDNIAPLVPSFQDELKPGHNALVYKRNELIHSQHNLSAGAQKMMAALLSQIDPRSNQLPKFEFTIRELANLLDVSFQSVYGSIDAITDELQQRFVSIPKIRPEGSKYSVEKHGFVKFNWFSRSTYEPDEKKAKFEFHEDLKPYVLELTGNFTKYRFLAIRKLNSKHSIRIYELLRRHFPMAEVDKGTKQVIRTIGITDLRDMLLLGEKYKKFYDFEKRVLRSAQLELQEKTDIRFDYAAVERKTPNSRAAVKNIRFIIRPNVQADHPMYQDATVSELLSTYCTAKAVEMMIKRYPEDIIRNNFEYVEQCEMDGMTISNKTSYLSYCLKYDMALNHHALKPNTYSESQQKEFLKTIIMRHWPDLNEDDKAEFRDYGFRRGILADLYKLWLENIDDATIDDRIWDELVTRNSRLAFE